MIVGRERKPSPPGVGAAAAGAWRGLGGCGGLGACGGLLIGLSIRGGWGDWGRRGGAGAAAPMICSPPARIAAVRLEPASSPLTMIDWPPGTASGRSATSHDSARYGCGWMDDVIFWPRSGRGPSAFLRIVSEVRRTRYDLAVLMANSFRSALVAAVARIRSRLGYDRDGRRFLLTDRRVESWCRAAIIAPCPPQEIAAMF